jgi:SpoIID/LytB domain protein
MNAIDGSVDNFTFTGGGWGHGVGLCQIGAAVMATRGFKAKEILAHYFIGAELKKMYK